MATNRTSVTSNSSKSAEKESSTVTYIFLASRLYPFGLSDSVKTDETGKIVQSDNKQIIALDVTTRFTNNWDASLTKYPVSSGSQISDHLTVQNNKYSLEGIISDTPFEKHDGELFGGYPTGSHRAMAAIEALEKMFKAKQVFTLFTEYQQIDKVVITGIKFEQVSQFALSFNIEMEQVRFAYARTVSLKVSASTKKTVDSNKNGGGSDKQAADSLEDYRRKVSQNKQINLQNNNIN